MSWLDRQGQFTGPSKMTITEEKLLIYLYTEVAGRKSKKLKKVRSGDTVTLVPTGVIGLPTFKLICSAVVRLWRQQQAAGVMHR
jgi:hypothetical protein